MGSRINLDKIKKISDELLSIENIIIEPRSLSQAFVVYGWQDQSGVIVYLDFADLHTRECTGHDKPDTADSDYEKWSPSDGRLSGKCLLGHTVTYTRRKPEKQCFNPQKYERAENYQNCPCTSSDFECDYGYERSTKNSPQQSAGAAIAGDCVKMSSLPQHEDPTKHIDGHKCVIRETKGYRRVPGDTCVGGSQWDAVEVPCPSSLSSYGLFILLVFLLIIAFFVFTYCTKAPERSYQPRRYSLTSSESLFDRIRSWLPSFSSKEKGYSLVGRGGYEPETAEEDFFENTEVGPSAHLIDSEPQQKLAQVLQTLSDAESSTTNSNSNSKKKIKSKKSKNNTNKDSVQFKGLPTAKQASKDVQAPAIVPPPGGSIV